MSQAQLNRQRFLIKEYKAVKESNNLKIQPTRKYDEYAAKYILDDIRNRKSIDSIKTCYLNRLEIIDLPNIYPLFNKFLDQTIEENLLQIILLSRLSKDIDLASSNAATILAKSDFSFKDLNLSDIRIPKADLSQCLFVNVNFQNSYLKEAQFLQSHLINVNFKNCDLSNAKFGVFMKIDWQNAIGLSFSQYDKQFYYRAGENIMKMNLKTQETKHKANINNFISSHIIDIYQTNLKRYWANVHGQYMEFWDQYETKPIFIINTAKAVFSPNWKYIAVLDSKSSALCWDIEKNKQTLGTNRLLNYKGAQLIFSPCSKYLGIIKTNFIYVIETENWTVVRGIYGKFAVKKAFAFSYNATRIAYSYTNLLELIDTETSAKTKIYLTHKKVRGMSFSPCGRFLAFGSNESAGYVMDLRSQRISHIFTGFQSNSISVLFSPSNKYISWTDSNSNIRVYEFFPNFLKNDYNRHYQILTAKISPKGTYLLTWSLEKSILWDLTTFTPKQIKKLTDRCPYPEFVFSPLETYIARGGYESIYIYDIKYDIFIVHKLGMYNWRYFSFSENEDYIISLNGTIYEYYKFPSFKLVIKYSTQEWRINSRKFSTCGRYHLYNNMSKLFLWNFDKNYFIASWSVNYSSSSDFNFTPLLEHIAYFDSKYYDLHIKVLNIYDAREIASLKIEGEIPVCHCFSSDEKLIVGGYKHGIINIWDIKTQTVLQKIRSLAFRDIDWIEAINDHILIREKDNIEIFKLDQLINL